MDINVIYGLKAPIQFELIRHDSDAAIRLESVNPDKISNRLFSSAYYDTYKSISGDRSVSVGDMKTGVSSMTFAGSDATVSGAAMAEENFYLYDSVSGHSIKSVTARVGSSDATSECISYDSDSGRYIVKMKQGIIIDVTSEPQTVHKSLFRISPRTSGLHLSRHILPKFSLIHKVLPAILASSGEKSGFAIRTRGDSEQALR